MRDIESLINKNNLSNEELDYLILTIKQTYWPEMKDKEVPGHCGICELFKVCKIVNSKLICPWLV